MAVVRVRGNVPNKVLRWSIENAIFEDSVLHRSELMKGLAMVADAMTTRIMASELSRSAKQDLLTELSSVPLILEEVAHAQTRLRRSNGKHPEED